MTYHLALPHTYVQGRVIRHSGKEGCEGLRIRVRIRIRIMLVFRVGHRHRPRLSPSPRVR